ncbi:hypothetical protein EMIHUDRAFT_121172 [Emiliania huxleyi CCMP1516]|uniref:SMP-30/Gluconolactonase/LRE-like region domain-containing protein n=2 Tax=Emiliania huxleyi TaxID=2903 RepID=A0A0D3I6F9_EMIH1|nr:hypothetical protein EMIHUDRAFT_121172 [Emiliania huxleyi CCMP1516]EOD06844.1 hypothetical protein EMIHUDRAFT_121172 [Emiliania huxleyi CCMP1516]|eukprot:XP_005759273.1 hypothetical protein EMIHUDRAFT_121172 [Emiliania huxleyi CCMP1516]
MASAASKRARTGEDAEEGEEPVPVAGGFEAPIFGQRAPGQVTTLALEGEDGPLSLSRVGVASDHAGAWYVATKDSLLHVPAASPDGSALFVADLGNHKSGELSGEDGDADGVGDAAQFSYPRGIALSQDGGALFVADLGNHKIRRVEVATGAVTTLAGSGEDGDANGVGDAAEFDYPRGIALSQDGGALFL